MTQDFIYIFQWWVVLFAIGIGFFPLTKLLFPDSKDSFYIFSKVIGIIIISYTLLLFGTLRILPFTTFSVFGVFAIAFLVNIYIYRKVLHKQKVKLSKIIIFEELLFFVCLAVWSYVRGFEPSIHGLEKFMDFGFVNSILRADYFPPRDMWFTPLSINYYFFGHLSTAVLTKLSGINPSITYNLMMATLFAFCAVGGFSLVFNFLSDKGIKRAFVGGILGGALISLSGNLHTIYAFFTSYNGEEPVPFWGLTFLPNLFPNGYWYPNATRFIPYTIHEFPLYSFVVSDLHGHGLDIPFVLFGIAVLYTIVKKRTISKLQIVVFSLLLAVMYMTNVWDSAIYMFLFGLVLLYVFWENVKLQFYKKHTILHIQKIKKIEELRKFLTNVLYVGGITLVLFIAFTLPFSISFKPFVSGIGVICAPDFLTDLKIHKAVGGEFIEGKLGPFLFEKDHCQRSPLYQLFTLYGFFFFFIVSFLAIFVHSLRNTYTQLSEFRTHIFIFLLIILAVILIIVPEFIYAKDIYPQHYRANTMFKLVYQSFMILSLVSAYVIIDIIGRKTKSLGHKLIRVCFALVSILLLFLVFLYPYFAVPSYYGELKTYKGIDGTTYLKTLHPGDYETINFINSLIPNQPIILEAQGDSYTDFARISSNTGLPTVLGWTVHEWLWRGSYDIPSPRIEEVKTLYEGNAADTKKLIATYKISYIYIGELERQKYPLLNEEKFKTLGSEIFRSTDGQSVLYKIRE